MLTLMADSSLRLDDPCPGAPGITVLTNIDSWAGAKVPVVARYLDDGGDPEVRILTTGEVASIHAVGRALLPVYNGSRLNGGYVPATAQEAYDLGVEDATRALQQYAALSGPASVYLGCDIEYNAKLGNDAKDGANWFLGFARTMRASNAAGAGIIYCSASAPGLAEAFKEALATGDQDVARLLFWIAKWDAAPCIAANLPAWDLGDTAPEIAQRTVGKQFCAGAYGGTCDLTELDITALAAAGPGGFWLPADAVPTPTPPLPAPKPRAVLAAVPARIDASEDVEKAYVTASLSGPRELGVPVEFCFDTGAFEFLLDMTTAQGLGIPNLAPLQVGGVTGSAPGYTSKMDVDLGGWHIAGADCVVLAGAFPLFGLRAFIERGLAVELDTKGGTLTVYGPES